MSSSRLVYSSEEASTSPFDWSPDGQWISVAVYRRDGTHQIGVVSTRDGDLRVLKSVDWKEPTKIFFSPDGKYLAYDLEATDDGIERHVFVLAVDGTSESRVVTDTSRNVIMGWSPDGQVLFSSDRSGSVGLWAVEVENGRPVGKETLLKPDIASAWSLGLTTSGTMYVWKYASPIYVQASSIDLATGKVASTVPAFQRFISSRGRPAWAPDGRHLAFQSCNPLGAGPCTLWIQSMETGELRRLPTTLSYFAFMSWSPDGRQILTQGRNARGRDLGLYRIDVETGKATLLALSPPADGVQWGVDSQHVTFRRRAAVIERNLESGAEREVMQIPTAGAGRSVMSPDGRSVAYLVRGQAGSQHIVTLPVSGGTPRTVFEAPAPYTIVPRLQWTADGRSLFVVKRHEEPSLSELWVVDVDGRRSRKIDVVLDQWQIGDGVDVDRAGRKIAFVAAAGQPGLEIRALENFLPAAKR
jgi:Tol biopolymer transport system component